MTPEVKMMDEIAEKLTVEFVEIIRTTLFSTNNDSEQLMDWSKPIDTEIKMNMPLLYIEAFKEMEKRHDKEVFTLIIMLSLLKTVRDYLT